MVRSFYILLIILFTFNAYAQFDKEIINPYVNLSEIHWLKSQKIDLSKTQIKDKYFIHNIRLILDLKTQDKKALGKFSGLIAVSVFSLLNYRFGDYQDETGAFTNTLLGTVGVTSVCLATKYFLEYKRISAKKNQLLRLTKDQYKLYMQ